jgi:hypothetical protein
MAFINRNTRWKHDVALPEDSSVVKLCARLVNIFLLFMYIRAVKISFKWIDLYLFYLTVMH